MKTTRQARRVRFSGRNRALTQRAYEFEKFRLLKQTLRTKYATETQRHREERHRAGSVSFSEVELRFDRAGSVSARSGEHKKDPGTPGANASGSESSPPLCLRASAAP